jgi:predicted transcriptional regulator
MSVVAAQVVRYLLRSERNGAVSPLHILADLSESPRSAEELTAAFDKSKSAVYRGLDELQERGFVRESPAEVGAYELTGIGAVIHYCLRTYQESPDSGPWDSVVYLCESESRVSVYIALQQGPSRKADIARGSDTPSRATVHRVIEGSAERELIESNGEGAFVLTRRGESALGGYEELVEAVTLIQRHSILFDCIGPAVADVPVHAFSSVEQVINEGTSPDRTMLAIEALVMEGITDVRGLRSFVSLKLTELFWPGIEAGTPHESIITTEVVRNLPISGSYWKFVRHGLTASNVTVLVVPEIESFPFSLGILNRDTVVLGPAHPGNLVETPTGLKSETIIGRDPALVDWAEQKYSEYRQLGQRPIAHLTTEIIDKLRSGLRTSEAEVAKD